MTKYKRLTDLELKELEKEFINFLVINGIVASEWEALKENDTEKTNLIIDQFSDVIYEGIMRKISFIEFLDTRSIKCFQCLDSEMVLVGVDANSDSYVDFTASKWTGNYSGLEAYTLKKTYKNSRELEIFKLIQAGAVPSDGTMFKQLCLLL